LQREENKEEGGPVSPSPSQRDPEALRQEALNAVGGCSFNELIDDGDMFGAFMMMACGDVEILPTIQAADILQKRNLPVERPTLVMECSSISEPCPEMMTGQYKGLHGARPTCTLSV
jgi:hypothetical protein